MLQLKEAQELLVPDGVTRVIQEMQQSGLTESVFNLLERLEVDEEDAKWIFRNEDVFDKLLRTT